MKLHLSKTDGLYTFSGYGEGYVLVNGIRHENNVLVTPTRLTPGWTGHDFDALTAEDFELLAATDAEIVILGTGNALRFPHPRLTQSLLAARRGLEVMDAQAACRTYNILAAEDRKVACALLLP
ncbi:Mth938-like domain-containing protein [Oryzomicrobium sp.]|uniref:Mth938-like domain-containing protein n=1 Tax=Oryzomicrobium sp. TaxID=1911578 RepID=UPI0025FCDE9E|nr:Mth938-like domain-containing protein [Oryzomicrobium sp.]MCE1242760.1 Mth938-like domain-containing protein [Oryzomicrobium sp.]